MAVAGPDHTAGSRPIRRRVLVVDVKMPTPDQDGGSASTLADLQILSRAGFRITFVPADLVRRGHYAKALEEIGITTLSNPGWTSIESVIETFGRESDVIFFYRAPVAGPLFELARRVAPTAKILFHPVDLHFLRMERQAALTGDPALADSARAMRDIELDLIRRADATVVVSSHELSLLQQLLPGAPVRHNPIFRETPSPPPDQRPGWEERHDFLFIGGYDHAPNADAVQWFVREVWPLVQSKGFTDRFIVAGSRVTPEIAALASDKVEVRGYVKDLASLFDACRLSVAPLRYGGGIKGKIVASLSYGVPVVATSIAAEGMDLREEENLLVADEPGAMADQIVRLYNDAALWRKLSANGYKAFQEKFSLESGTEKLVGLFDGLCNVATGL